MNKLRLPRPVSGGLILSYKCSGGILVSVNPFTLEHVPFERAERAVRIGREVFGKENTVVYQSLFYHQFRAIGVKGTLPLNEYLQRAGARSLLYAEIIPMGRACYKLEPLLEGLYGRHPARHFFGESCVEELTRRWHVHIDNYGNYITGHCGGISLGSWLELSSADMNINLDELPIAKALMTNMKCLHEIAEKLGYRERERGYVHKCHLCVDIRKYIAEQTDEFKELTPREFYAHLT